MHILSPETDNCPSWISRRVRMTAENISWSISTKECCQPRRGLNPRPPGLQSDGASSWATDWLIVLGFNDTSTLMGHFVSSPREREKRDRRDSRRDEREGQGRKRNRNESEETEEIKTSPPYPYLLQRKQALPNCKPIPAGRPGDIRYMTPLHHPTTSVEPPRPAKYTWDKTKEAY